MARHNLPFVTHFMFQLYFLIRSVTAMLVDHGSYSGYSYRARTRNSVFGSSHKNSDQIWGNYPYIQLSTGLLWKCQRNTSNLRKEYFRQIWEISILPVPVRVFLAPDYELVLLLMLIFLLLFCVCVFVCVYCFVLFFHS